MTNNLNKTAETVKASPTKRFFVDMLTRDIELQDAILDLLDNCIDGLQRSHRETPPNKDRPFEGYWAKIVFNEKKFQIVDNCGGIPIDLAKRYAFMMGRPREEDDSDIPTVGMYGIGMKRAIFKMGRSSRVSSQTSNEAFEVTITPKWLDDDNDWDLPLKHIKPPREETGTLINVEHLRDSVSRVFDESSFNTDLIEIISQHYGFIINKGFGVFVNTKEVEARKFTLLWSDPNAPDHERIAPFLYQANRDGVDIKLAVGFYKPMIKLDELDEEAITRRSKEDAGWTVICNDRVVIYNDKTRLTGWGEAGVPNYHSQFIGITGIVHFKSNDAWKLPITTTKRGVDASSETYLYVKDLMREGLKKFTSYTNTWKTDPATEKEISAKAKSVSMEEIFAIKPDAKWTKVRNLNNELKYNLTLAVPVDTDPRKQIRFTKHLSEIRKISEILFDDPSVAPGEVGEACFDRIMKEAQKK
jgi:hypothetical protein